MLRSAGARRARLARGPARYIRERWGSCSAGFVDRLLLGLDVARGRGRRSARGFAGDGGGPRTPARARVAAWLADPAVSAGPRRSAESRALQPRPRLDAARGADREERLRLARPALEEVRARRSTGSTRSPTRSSTCSRARGFTGLWLIGLWERSPASQRIKQLRGNPDAVASAYSLHDYDIADDLGGEARLRGPARSAPGSAGIRLATRHGAEPRRHRLALGDRAPRLVPLSSTTARSPATRFGGPGPLATIRASASSSRITTTTAPTRRSCSGAIDRHDRREPLHLPRQRRHQHAVERHRAARLPERAEVREAVIQTILARRAACSRSSASTRR